MEKTKQITTGIDQVTQRKIVGTAQAIIPLVKVYLFGSRALGKHHNRSDIDIALDAGEKLPRIDVGEIRDMLEASHIPYKIDVLDIWSVDQELRDTILREGILWSN